MEFWCGGFHLYTLNHVFPRVSTCGATGEDLGVKIKPSVSYSNSVSKIVLIASSIAEPSPAKNSFVSILSVVSDDAPNSVEVSRTNCRAHPRRDKSGFFLISSSVVNSGRERVSLPLK